VHQPRTQPLEQLALPEHDRHLVARPPGRMVCAVARGRRVHQPAQKDDPADEQGAADSDRRGKRESGDERAYVARAFLISAEMAGTTSCRSPITA
jgi:hypothetical protein